ncbi:MAG: hypothetical protein Q9214_001979 [Letrouitia sp. 1 TL-2023]
MAEGPAPRDATLTAVDLNSIPFQAVFADVVRVSWAETDSQILRLRSQAGIVASGTHTASKTTAVSTSLLITSSSTPEIAARPVVASSTTTPFSKSSSTIVSPGTKAGIAVGATMGSLTVTVLAFLFGRRQRQKAKAPGASNQFLSGDVGQVAELAGTGQYSRWTAELASQAPELPHDHVRIELDSRTL